MASRDRYISPSELGVLIADLHLTSTMFQDRLLEFFERQRLVVPVARIRWPTALVIEARGGAPAVPATDEQRRASKELDDALRHWDRPDADPELDHPLDRRDQSLGTNANMVIFGVADRSFEPWDTFRTNIRPEGESPLYVTDAVDTYYHAWQVLLVADALDMGMKLIFDTRQPDLMNLALTGDFRNMPDDVAWVEVSFQGPRGLDQGLRWGPFFDAGARVEAVRQRKLNAISRVHGNEPFTLCGAELKDFNQVLKRATERALAFIKAAPPEIVSFLVYLCRRWDEWMRRGRQEVAAEYKRQLVLTAQMAMVAQDREFASLVEEVGRVTGHFKNTLDVIFPDWTREVRTQAELSLRHSIVAKAPSAELPLMLTDADVTDLLDWLERQDFWKIHLSIETILARQFSASSVDLAALAKEVESISTTFEHAINILLEESGLCSTGGLMKKLQRFWKIVPGVDSILSNQHRLVSTKPPMATLTVQLAKIAALASTDPNAEVARVLLIAVLYRNDGLHNSMASWSEKELHEATRVFLTALMFCRKNFLASRPVPART